MYKYVWVIFALSIGFSPMSVNTIKLLDCRFWFFVCLSGVITSFVVDPCHSWLTVGTSAGMLVCWDLRFQLPITNLSHPRGTLFVLFLCLLNCFLHWIFIIFSCAHFIYLWKFKCVIVPRCSCSSARHSPDRAVLGRVCCAGQQWSDRVGPGDWSTETSAVGKPYPTPVTNTGLTP